MAGSWKGSRGWPAAARDLPARLFIASGLLEGDPEPFAMVANMHRLADALESRGHPSLRVSHQDFADETHLSMIGAAYSRGLREVFQGWNDPAADRAGMAE